MSKMEINQSDDNSDSLLASIQEELSKLPPRSSNFCIYRIPESLRQVNKDAYTPIVVSIGPYHYKDKRLLPMEVQKLRYLKFFLDASGSNGDIKTFLRIVKDRESEIRKCYEDATTSRLSSDEFNRMVLIDSTFIIMIFWRLKHGIAGDQICERPFKFEDVFRDIMLVENQLPFFILDDLYQTAFASDVNPMPSFTDIACEIFKVDKERIGNNAEIGEMTFCHLLNLSKIDYAPKLDGRTFTCPSATSLYEAGIKFRAASRFDSLLDIRFDKGILTIPKLMIVDSTEYKFRNLIAFEHCNIYMLHNRISDYVFFMDCLINTPKDVQLLVGEGIIDNLLGSNQEVSNMFNSLCKHVFLPIDYKFGRITAELNSYCKQPWNRYRATLQHTYFMHPWAVISVVYAAILLILTLIQVVTGIISVM